MNERNAARMRAVAINNGGFDRREVLERALDEIESVARKGKREVLLHGICKGEDSPEGRYLRDELQKLGFALEKKAFWQGCMQESMWFVGW